MCGVVPCDGTSLTNAKIAGCQNWTASDGIHRKALGVATSATYGFDVPEPYDGFTVLYKNGDTCSSGPRQMLVKYLCSSADTTPRLVYEGETSHCVFEFTVYAKYGPCAVAVSNPSSSPPPSKCAQGYKFYPDKSDMSTYYEPYRLAVASSNPYFATSDATGVAYTFNVNVCGEVSCPYSSVTGTHAACQEWNVGGVTSGKSLGTLDSIDFLAGPQGAEGYIVSYTGGDACSGGSPRQTRVAVVCSPLDFTPRFEFFGEFSKCVFDFTLYAREGACPVSTKTVTPPPPSAACPTTLKLSDKLSYYSVRTLALAASKPYTYTDGSNEISINYSLNVCVAVPCNSGPPASACQSWTSGGVTTYKSLGQVSLTGIELAVPETSGFNLFYEGGDTCSGGDVRHSIVHAICDPSIKGQPRFQFLGETSHCEFEFSLTGADACPTMVAPAPVVGCGGTLVTPDGQSHYPFKELTMPSPLHESDPDGGPGDEPFEYLINLCAPVSCPYSLLPQSVISGCQMWKDPSDGTPHSKAIGRIDQAKFTASPLNTGFTAEFGGGDVCSGEVARTTRITVTCSAADANPRLIYLGETEKCVFEFQLLAAQGACPVALPGVAPPPTPTKTGVSGGVIAVILLVVLAVLAGAGFAGYRYYKKRQGGADPISAATFTASSCASIRSRLPCFGRNEYAFAQLGQEEANEDDAY